MLSQSQFIADVEAHLKATGVNATNFGKDALGDPNFVFDLRNGRSPSLKVIERVYQHMRKRPPEEAPTPVTPKPRKPAPAAKAAA